MERWQLCGLLINFIIKANSATAALILFNWSASTENGKFSIWLIQEEARAANKICFYYAVGILTIKLATSLCSCPRTNVSKRIRKQIDKFELTKASFGKYLNRGGQVFKQPCPYRMIISDKTFCLK